MIDDIARTLRHEMRTLVDEMARSLREELHQLKRELQQDRQQFKNDMQHDRQQLKQELQQYRQEFQEELKNTLQSMFVDLAKELKQQIRDENQTIPYANTHSRSRTNTQDTPQLLNIYEDIVGPEQPAIEPLAPPPPKTATPAYASPRAVITLWQDHLSDLRRVKRNHHVYARIAERLVALGIEKTVKEVKIENLGNLFG
ncbi:hypothetical protein HPB48_021504 [Haemaphysalis longicornis]|uniref:Uncharacterized protein n=1 Tax=Haemaphysalis longicornis TaxID=44386 RepID=A0A9J6G885_HAELO|nr:hypothetical protein HPB48_021504 [Haemaphysalis longicornis]